MNPFYYQDPKDRDNEITVAAQDGGVCVSVAEEKAVDSYNDTFNCSITLDAAQARRLRDYLNGCITDATEVSIHGMYEMHLFHSIKGKTVDEIIANWMAHNAKLQPAIVGGDEVDDMGPSMLCPAIVLAGKKELRRVGKMVFTDKTRGPKNYADVEEYRQALLSDPDIPRLLAASGEIA